MKEDDRYYLIKLKVPKTMRDVRGIVQLLATLERSDLRPEAREALDKIKKLWDEVFPP